MDRVFLILFYFSQLGHLVVGTGCDTGQLFCVCVGVCASKRVHVI